jgi:adenosylcobinamide-phosphate synthase
LISLILALAAGIGLDFSFGDPRNRYHPVAWLGRAIGVFVPMLESQNQSAEKAKGVLFALGITVATGLGVYLAGALALAVASAVILKLTIAVRGMETHAKAIMRCLESGDLDGARGNLSMIVRRRTDDLSERHVLSATIECISESTVDGITGPIFYYSLFGPAGAAAYRTINTLDSMIGRIFQAHRMDVCAP